MADLEIQQTETYKELRWQVIFIFLLFGISHSVSSQINYSIFEEIRKGSSIGNIARDLGLDVKDLSIRKFRIDSHISEKYFAVNLENGNLYVKERIDREALCESQATCILTFDAVVENPLNVFHVKVEIQDINDNAPRFFYKVIELEIVESTSPGARFVLQDAQDLDVGINSLVHYKLSDNEHFILNEKTGVDGSKFPELLLEKPMDRETQNIYELILVASDGGTPVQTGNTLIKIIVTDSNDNFPIFTQEIYKVSVAEDTPINSTVICVNATDKDDGINGQITYYFSSTPENTLLKFYIDPNKGEIKTKNNLDFEKARNYELSVQAKDGGGLIAHCKVLIEITDENDNAPEISVTSLSSPIPEDSTPGTVIALVKVQDKDSGINSEFDCQVLEKTPFQLISSSGNYYKIVTTSFMDRETVQRYNVTIIATDKGFPPLINKKIITVEISDINDNPPIFDKSIYVAYVPENNLPGSSIYNIHASDLDTEINSKLMYSLINTPTEDISESSYLSINPVTGVIYAQRSFDYEQQKEFSIQIMAKDSGSPPMSSNTTLRICIVDQNDNTPEILYPMAVSEIGSSLTELVPLTSEEGLLVTKVVAVDADSGHNAWLSYHFIQTSESSPFIIDHRTGEIRTARTLHEKDTLRQKVVIMVKDNGNPYLSATTTLTLVIVDSFQKVITELSDDQISHKDPQSNLQIYLIIALVIISCLFILTVLIVVISRCKDSYSSENFPSLSTNVYSQVDPRFLSKYNNGTLPLPYSYNVCVALDSSESEFTFRPPVQNVPVENLIDADDSVIGTDSVKEALPDDLEQVSV
ncbi:protocadherin gamma-B1-like [Bombina bombina]|uniref:protocadherin gamma-B1-like n=1 Tax=Bombina bombina TaxID=8345 RepID=UPI00235AE400|nr:protocadherin gamma-B1-like [Bombina bombina]